MSELLRVQDLRVAFPVRAGGLFVKQQFVHALDGVSLTLARGEALGLVGESGCGKSTLARALVGLEKPTSGSIHLEDVELSALSQRDWRRHRHRIQMVFQDPLSCLDPRQTIGSAVMEPLRILGRAKPRERRGSAIALLEAVGLHVRDLERYPHEMSGGQRQRVGIARALALEPDILICDEPVSALDVSIQAQTINLLLDLQERFALATLFIAHDLAVVRQLCTRVAVMHLGRIVEEAPRDVLLAHPSHPYTKVLLSSVPVPDPRVERERKRVIPHGELPSPINMPPGCSFHTRCHERDQVPDERCEVEVPTLDTLDENTAHRCACHIYSAKTATS